jgi:hypothetical protein
MRSWGKIFFRIFLLPIFVHNCARRAKVAAPGKNCGS